MPIHPTRISPRAAIMVVFSAFGAAIGTLAGAAPSVLRQAGVDSEAFGLALTASTAATVLAMSLGGAIARLASNRLMLLAALPVFWLALTAFLMSGSPVWFAAAFLPMGFMFGLTDLFMNAEATAIEHDLRRPVFTAIHGCVSLSTAVHAIAASLLANIFGTAAAAGLAGVSFALAWLMVLVAIPPRPLVAGRHLRILALPNKMPLVLLGVAAGLIIAAETAALLWSAKLLDDMAPSLAAIAGIGAAFFGLCNALVRFPGDLLRQRFGDMLLMAVSLCVAISGFCVLGLSGSFALSVAAFATVGLGLALLMPCIFAVAARFVPANRAGGLGFISMLSGLPRILAPWAFGLVASGFGINVSFGLVALALAVALGLVLALTRIQQAEQMA